MNEYKLVPVEPDEQWARALHDVCRNGKDVYYDQDLLLAMIYNVLAAAPDASAVQAKPVAWLLECQTFGGDTGWILSWSKSGAGLCNRLQGEHHEKPLYAHPPAADPVADKLAEALRILLGLHDNKVDVAEPWNLTMEEARAALAEYDRQKGGK